MIKNTMIKKDSERYNKACNAIRDLFIWHYYLIMDKDIQYILNNDRWIKLYTKKILNKAWKDLKKENYVEEIISNYVKYWRWEVI